jgi:predicted TIM-barrel fold metal-dependent hydrolase
MDGDKNNLLEKMEMAGVYGGGLISPCPLQSKAPLLKLEYKERLKSVLDWTKNSNGRLIPILWVHPEEDDVLNRISNAAEEGIAAFKIICDNFYVSDPACMRMLEQIEKTKKPVLFHTGILWSGRASSKYNRPCEWESLLEFKNVKFSMGHCSWPWIDECIAVYGKFLNYYNTEKRSEMFFDITPGTPEIYRKELITKLFTVGYDVEDNIMFGTDSLAEDYHPEWAEKWLRIDNGIMDELGVSDAVREKIYEGNLMRFLKGDEVSHILPQINK